MSENKSVVCVGEIMLELSNLQPDGNAKLGYGGDTGNTAIYLSRLFGGAGRVGYLTRLGQGAFSDRLAQALVAEQVEQSPSSLAQAGTPGLYAIDTDDEGERSFTYWRDSAAVRELFCGEYGEAECAYLKEFDALYFSGITLAVLSDQGRQRLLEIAQQFIRSGREVMFDVNFRPHLWQSHAPHIDVPTLMKQVIASCSIVKIGRDEGEDIFGVKQSRDLIEKLRAFGEAKLVVTDGGDKISVFADDEIQEYSFELVDNVVDSTAAGDSFSAGFLHAFMRGSTLADCVSTGQKLAATVIQYSGAIIPKCAMPRSHI